MTRGAGRERPGERKCRFFPFIASPCPTVVHVLVYHRTIGRVCMCYLVSANEMENAQRSRASGYSCNPSEQSELHSIDIIKPRNRLLDAGCCAWAAAGRTPRAPGRGAVSAVRAAYAQRPAAARSVCPLPPVLVCGQRTQQLRRGDGLVGAQAKVKFSRRPSLV